MYAPPPGPPPGMPAQVFETNSHESLAYMDDPRQLAQGNSGHEQPPQEPHDVAHGGHVTYSGGEERHLPRSSDPVPQQPPLESYEPQLASNVIQHQEGPQEPGNNTTGDIYLVYLHRCFQANRCFSQARPVWTHLYLHLLKQHQTHMKATRLLGSTTNNVCQSLLPIQTKTRALEMRQLPARSDKKWKGWVFFI